MTNKIYVPGERIYIAGPFFNPQQNERITKIEELCKQWNRAYVSPRSFLVLKPDATKEDRESVFKKNCEWMVGSDLIIACMDDKDTGTLWEMGFGYGIGRKVIGFYEDDKAKINVMLAEACAGFIRGWEALAIFLSNNIEGNLEYDWHQAKKWKKEVE